MAGLNYDYWPCPFCDKGIIEVLVRPRTFSAKRTACRAGRSTTMRKVEEETIITTEKCPNCCKTSEEIERKWREEGII